MTANNNESITNDNEWYNKWQRGENEQQQVTKNDNEWQRVVIPTNFAFFEQQRNLPLSNLKRAL